MPDVRIQIADLMDQYAKYTKGKVDAQAIGDNRDKERKAEDAKKAKAASQAS